ncbi:hypothetical protein GQ53DRAFT_649652 [Thozetella sp. PMI_491]|nr:hypothetical protein GQ53DRAFT_649652 [Thozetella sp. PMI_491]
MTTPFSFSFSGEDIEDDQAAAATPASPTPNLASTAAASSASASAFPVQGKPLLPPVRHELDHMLARLPSKIAYSLLAVDLNGGTGGVIQLPRRELWDVRVQLMAEDEAAHGDDDAELDPGLGKHDVKTGIYEGGFKSWESSVDLVKVLAAEHVPQMLTQHAYRWIELGCGTALPSLAIFQWAAAAGAVGRSLPLTLTMADYNPSVLYLVTLPNFVLAWALQQREGSVLLEEALSSTEGELELGEAVVAAFKEFLISNHITLSFLSGAWSTEFVDLLYPSEPSPASSELTRALVAGAETIYSPFALSSFTETLLSILQREHGERPGGQAVAIIAAKRLYFGVGGSLDDFVAKIQGLGAHVDTLREETEGVRRGVVRCFLP